MLPAPWAVPAGPAAAGSGFAVTPGHPFHVVQHCVPSVCRLHMPNACAGTCTLHRSSSCLVVIIPPGNIIIPRNEAPDMVTYFRPVNAVS